MRSRSSWSKWRSLTPALTHMRLRLLLIANPTRNARPRVSFTLKLKSNYLPQFGHHDPTPAPHFRACQPYLQHMTSGQPSQSDGPHLHHGRSPVPGGQPHILGGQPFPSPHRGCRSVRGGRRPTIDPLVIGRVVNESTGFDKESMNRSMNMSVPTMGLNTDF
jgi:hypothetical protein